jgi:hypothetical protein
MRCWWVPRLLVLGVFLASGLLAQTPMVTVSSVSINIDPANTDSYDLQGTISGLTLAGASYVLLSMGNFGAGIPISNFVQQPGSNVFLYQDSTGQTPYWVSSLTLDMDAQVFHAQASGIVLAGLTNPFAVQLGTDRILGCAMARVQQTGMGTYQLTPGDPVGTTCELQTLPVAVPQLIAAGAPTDTTISATILAYTGIPQNLQLFRTDGDAQPIGDPLCTLTTLPLTGMACTVTFNEANPGAIPLIVQATLNGKTVLSPGFSIQVVNPATDDNVQQLSDIENAVMQAWQNFTQFGDTPYARIQTLATLRTMLAPAAGLTAQPIGLALDGLSIVVQSDSGLPVVMVLNDLADMLPSTGVSSPPAAVKRRQTASSLRPRAATLQCGNFQRDVVANNSVQIWSPGDLFGFTGYQLIVDELKNSKCPAFQFDNPLIGSQATPASLTSLSGHGTIILNSHGGYDSSRGYLLSGEPSKRGVVEITAARGFEATGCVPEGCYKAVYSNHPNLSPLTNAIIYGGFCHSFEGGSHGFSGALAPPGSNSSYFGYNGCSPPFDDVTYGSPLFDRLINSYSSTFDAYNVVLALGGGGTSPDLCISPKCELFGPATRHFGMTGDFNLAYTGNPQLASSNSTVPYVVGMFSSLNLTALLDGASSCSAMNFNWANTANGGHLASGDGSGQDNFMSANANVTYNPKKPPEISPVPVFTRFDQVMVDFLPDPANPVAARACANVTVTEPDQILHVVYDGQGQSTETVMYSGLGTTYTGTSNLTWHAEWDLHMPVIGTAFLPVLPGSSVTGMTTASVTATGFTCSGPPVINTDHGNGPAPTVQSPYIGAAAFAYPMVPMYVETFGGVDYNLCGGMGKPAVGDYGTVGPGYPGWDLASEIFMFNLDLSQYYGKTTTMSMAAVGHLQTPDGASDSGTVDIGGTLTFSTVAPCDARTQACAPSVRQQGR